MQGMILFKGKLKTEIDVMANSKEEAIKEILEQFYCEFVGGSARIDDIEITFEKDFSNVPVTEAQICKKCDGFCVAEKCVKCGHINITIEDL